jgi:hypothetical protein
MIVKTSYNLMIGVVVLVALMPVGILTVIMSSQTAFADNVSGNICIGHLTCSAIGGSGGRGGDTGDATSGDIGDGGSCSASDHSSIGDECGGSTGSSEPRSGSGDHSMNGGRGGEATVDLNA